MSCDFYFKRWRCVLGHLEGIVELDLHYQETKAHEKTLCGVVHHLSGVLGLYMAIYNEIMECYHQNLQLQKTAYMADIVKAVVARMLELKHDLQKLENSNIQFFGTGIIQGKLTTNDIDLLDIPDKVGRSEEIQSLVDNAFARAKEIIEYELRRAEEEKQMTEATESTHNWWDTDEKEESSEDEQVELAEQLSEEALKKKAFIAMIQAQEKTRQVTAWLIHRQQKRELWEKDLEGTLRPPARIEMRERSAKLIQKVIRAYFELKRKKIDDCRRDELLGINKCEGSDLSTIKQAREMLKTRSRIYQKYSDEWKLSCEEIKQQFVKKKGEGLKEDYRDFIRDWFQKWFNEVRYIHEIPKLNDGGATLIFKEEMSSPMEWIEEYKKYMEQKKANKKKTATEKKYEKMEANREKMMLKKEELMKKKVEAELLKKIKKNPNLHPGFDYPQSKKMEHLLEVIEHYKNDWDNLDKTDMFQVKVKSVKDMDINNACMEAKLELLNSVDEDMRSEFKILRSALKRDYANNGEKMPEDMKKPARRRKKKRKVKAIPIDRIAGMLESLAVHGFLKEYPRITFEDFIGDPNYAGEELRCQYQQAFPHHGDIRRIWWDRCREMTHGFHKILLVGPRGSGKTTLVHVIASLNDSVLFVLDPKNIPEDFLTPVYLQQLTHSIVACAKAVQPSVIYIKHVQRLYYSKVPEEEKDLNLDLLKRYLTKKLFKKIHKTDKVTIIGSCLEPWTTQSKKMLKQFTFVHLLPNTCYSTVAGILHDWVFSHSVIPKDFDISSLARMLQGYNFGYLKDVLNEFLTPDRIIRIAAHGLSSSEIYDYIIQDDSQIPAEYEKYLKWYTDKTPWGIKEKKHLEEQKEFLELQKKFAEKEKKKKRKSPKPSRAPSLEDIEETD